MRKSTRRRSYRGVPRDVTRDEVIVDDDMDDEDGVMCGVGEIAEWRLNRPWIDDLHVSQLDPFIVSRPSTLAAAAADDGDDDDDDECLDCHRRRSRPDLVPHQSSFMTSPVTRQELDKTCDDVKRQLPSPIHCHCVSVSQSDVMT